MNKVFSRLALSVSKINKNTLVMILVLAMLVLGAGAPEIVGGFGG